MKKSYSIEILLIFFSALTGMIIWQGGWMILIGSLLLMLISYFLTSALKLATLEEYLEAVKNKKK